MPKNKGDRKWGSVWWWGPCRQRKQIVPSLLPSALLSASWLTFHLSSCLCGRPGYCPKMYIFYCITGKGKAWWRSLERGTGMLLKKERSPDSPNLHHWAGETSWPPPPSLPLAKASLGWNLFSQRWMLPVNTRSFLALCKHGHVCLCMRARDGAVTQRGQAKANGGIKEQEREWKHA